MDRKNYFKNYYLQKKIALRPKLIVKKCITVDFC